MKSISGKAFCKVLERKGWILKRVKGSHHIYKNPESNAIISVPVHSNKDLKTGTLKALMRNADLSERDLE
jgi:predicted RNA binding protein YcfA (HicA-like mRNA interferase family)